MTLPGPIPVILGSAAVGVATTAAANEAMLEDPWRFGIGGALVLVFAGFFAWLRRRLSTGQIRVVLQSKSGAALDAQIEEQAGELRELRGRIRELEKQRKEAREMEREWQIKYMEHLEAGS